MPDPQYDIPNDPDVTPEDIGPGADLAGANLTDANLRRTDLTDADLSGADLTGADLRGAHLTDTNLSDADLTGAYITNTQLTDAQLTDARFDYTIPNDKDVSPRDIISETSIPDADLSGAGLAHAKLRAADLTDADLSGADLTDVDLGGADLTGADLWKADLTDASLRYADLTDADLVSANLTGAELSHADLTDADLVSANLTGAELSHADLTGANLASASLDHVRLYETSLEGISINEGTTATPPSRWELEADDAAESWLGWFDRKGFYWLRFLGRSASDQNDLQKAEQQYRRLERLYREADLSRDSALEIQEKHARRKRALAEDDPRLGGRIFVQRESDPFGFVDGDDVRDPESGDVHPVFKAFLKQLGLTYADISTSGSGAHAYYIGEIPLEGKGQASFEIDDEPWGANDTVPSIEFYANKHLCVATGDQVVGTPTGAAEWDADALRAILKANGFDDEEDAETVAHDTDHDRVELEQHDPDAMTPDETADDVRDVVKAVDRLGPTDLPLSTAHTGEDSTGWSTWDPSYRSSNSGESLHYNGEGAFYDHDKGEDFGVLSLFAAEESIIREPWERLEGAEWWEAVDAARDAGASVPKFDRVDPDAEAVAPLALEKLDALGADDRERAARKRGAEIPSTREARERLRNAIFRELRAENSTVLDAPTALGKSHTVATEPWRRRESTTGGAPVVHLHETTDARDDAVRATGASSATGDALLGRKEASPLARGDHDPVADPDSEEAPDVVVTIDGEPASEWFDRQCDEKGLPFSTALAIARERNDQGLDELPPFGEEDPAVAQWDGLPRDDDGEPAVDVIHATHQFAHVPSLRTHTNVVLDEQPDFTVDVGQERIRRMITVFLREINAPVNTFEAFVTLARGTSTGGDAAAERDHLGELLKGDHGLDAEWFIDNTDAHAVAPALARAVWNALRWEDADANGRHATKVVHEPPRFDAEKEDFAARTILSVVVDEENTVRRVRSTPDFSQARSVIGLDAHPSMPLWELNAAAGMTTDAVLGREERRLWRRFERRLTVVQVGDATRPRSGPKAVEWMNDERVRAVVEALREQYGSGFKTALATRQTEPRLRSILADVAHDVDAENTLHFGEEKSRNDFAGEDAGYVYGCMDPGDDMVLDALAELGVEATPEQAETYAGNAVRAKGRGFDGPDDDTAAAVLASVRENHVAQAAGRYARNADDPDSEATVYVHTDAAPEGFVDFETPGVEWLATDLQRDVIDALTERADATAREIADAVGCSKEHVRETLRRLEEKGLVDREEGAGAYGADVYRDDGAEPREVDLGEIANDRLMDLSRWSLAIDGRHGRDDVDAGAGADPTTVDGGVTAGDPPDR